MKIAAHVLAYDVNRFIGPVIENLEKQVDKIYIAYSELPWGYNIEARSSKKNPTRLTTIKTLTKNRGCEIEIIEGNWETEQSMRNECLERARKEGFDWFIAQDADEFYSETSWKQIKNILATDKTTNHFITTMYNFWKSPKYVLEDEYGNIKELASLAIRCNSDIYFTRARSSNSINSVIIDCPCYHYGYVKTNVEMQEKISTWAHANEIFLNSKTWYQVKWEHWDLSTSNLHPVSPSSWKRAIFFPLEQPDFAYQFEIQNEKILKKSRMIILKSLFYDLKWRIYVFLRDIKRNLL